jgi:hypothetical protein
LYKFSSEEFALAERTVWLDPELHKSFQTLFLPEKPAAHGVSDAATDAVSGESPVATDRQFDGQMGYYPSNPWWSGISPRDQCSNLAADISDLIYWPDRDGILPGVVEHVKAIYCLMPEPDCIPRAHQAGNAMVGNALDHIISLKGGRGNVWITFEIPSAVKDVEALQDLVKGIRGNSHSLERFDLCLVHRDSVFGSDGELRRAMWEAMEELVYEEEIQNIGASGFTDADLRELMEDPHLIRCWPLANRLEPPKEGDVGPESDGISYNVVYDRTVKFMIDKGVLLIAGNKSSHGLGEHSNPDRHTDHRQSDETMLLADRDDPRAWKQKYIRVTDISEVSAKCRISANK